MQTKNINSNQNKHPFVGMSFEHSLMEVAFLFNDMINLKQLELKLDDALAKETKESLNEFLKQQRTEIWKDIEGYKGYYQVSNLGRVKSLKRFVYNAHNSFRITKEIILIPKKHKTGYLYTALHLDNYTKSNKIHRLVAQTFIANPNNYPQVNHIDGDKQNNNDYNLEWCNNSQNVKHSFKIGLRNHRGENHPKTKFKNKDILYIRNSNKTTKELSKEFNIHTTTILKIKNKKTWKHI